MTVVPHVLRNIYIFALEIMHIQRDLKKKKHQHTFNQICSRYFIANKATIQEMNKSSRNSSKKINIKQSMPDNSL